MIDFPKSGFSFRGVFSIAVFFFFLFFMEIIPTSVPCQTETEDEKDISGVWLAETEVTDFQVLLVPNRESGEGFFLLMLKPGSLEREYGFMPGDHVATLSLSSSDCWIADEIFRLPQRVGGGTYRGETSYCLTDDTTLLFHTDDPDAAVNDYPLVKLSEGIDAAGVWQLIDASQKLIVILAPDKSDGWVARYASGYEGKINLGIGDIAFRGEEAPDEEGTECFVYIAPKGANIKTGSGKATAILLDESTLEIGIGGGIETGLLALIFARIY